MTNQQLAVLFLNLHHKFSIALEEAERELPDSARVMIKPLFGKGYRTIPALYGIQAAVDDLKKQADLLTTTTTTQGI